VPAGDESDLGSDDSALPPNSLSMEDDEEEDADDRGEGDEPLDLEE